MEANAIKAAWKQLRADLRAHWRACLAEGLEDHSPKAHNSVDKALEAYFKELARLAKAGSKDKAQILEAIQRLFSRIDEAAERFGGGLLETDERELIVPPVVEAAELAGLNLSEFPDDDPTSDFRHF